MKSEIQFITAFNNTKSFDKFTVTDIEKPRALDDFSINVIDLSNGWIWKNDENNYRSVNCIIALKNIINMINNSAKCKIVVILPKDLDFYYFYSIQNKSYYHSEPMRNIISEVETKILTSNLGFPYFKLAYENTITQMGDVELNSNFYMTKGYKILTKSLKSDKVTTCEQNGIVYTTLIIKNDIELLEFIKNVNLIENSETEPEWMSSIVMFDDERITNSIAANEQKIIDIRSENDILNGKLTNNKKWKSILYSNGEPLVNVVFEILQQILDVDLSSFIDEKNEDFYISFENCHIIGEIKGVTSNIKSEHISQVDVHLHGYIDKNENLSEEVNVKSILIVNHQRSKPLDIRQPVHQRQIELAKRNNCLIIESYTLLRLFEKYLTNELKSNEIRSIFAENVGVLSI